MIVSKKIQIDNLRVQIHLSKHWGSPRGATSQAKNERLKNRQLLQFALNQHKEKFNSISHTEKLGGFAVSNHCVGLDIENSRRVMSPAVLRRLGTKEELAVFQNPIELWVAKEAAWKAFRGHKKYRQPDVISDIQIVKKVGRNKFYFSTHDSKEKTFSGKIMSYLNHKIAIVAL